MDFQNKKNWNSNNRGWLLKKCIVRRKYRGSSENRGPSEKVGPSENGACLLRQVQGTKYRELSVNRGPSENIGPSENGTCLRLSTETECK